MFSALLLAAFVQDSDPAADLKARGWAAVDAWSARPEAKSRLAALAASPDRELRWWGGAALAELEAREHCLPPLRVTLEATDELATDVLRTLLEKVKLRLVAGSDGEAKVRVAFRDAPFLEALDDVCRQADSSLARQPSGEFQRVPGEGIKGPRFYRSGFAAVLSSAVMTSEATFDEPPSSRLAVAVSLRGDPTTLIPDADVGCEIVEVRDDTGKSLLLPDSPPAEVGAGVFHARVREPVLAVKITLDVPARAARRIGLLRGIARVTMVRKREEIVFDKVLSGEAQTREVGPVRGTLARCVRDGSVHAVDLDLRSKTRARWPDSDGVILEDAPGNAYPEPLGSANSGGTRAEYRLTYRDREGSGPPERIRLSVVTETAARKVYFELKDVPLR